MEFYYYTVFLIFTVILMMMIIDANVSSYIDLQFKLLIVNLNKLWFRIKLYPTLKYQTWQIQRQVKKIQNQIKNNENN